MKYSQSWVHSTFLFAAFFFVSVVLLQACPTPVVSPDSGNKNDAGVEKTTPDTAPVDKGTPQDTAPVDKGTPQDTAPVDKGTPRDTAPVDKGTPQDTAPVDKGTPQDTAPTDQGATKITYAKDIAPLFQKSNCTSSYCHGGTTTSGGFNIGKGADSIINVKNKAGTMDYISPGDPTKSYLYLKISSDTPPAGVRMPKGAQMSGSDVQLVKDWITQGAMR